MWNPFQKPDPGAKLWQRQGDTKTETRKTKSVIHSLLIWDLFVWLGLAEISKQAFRNMFFSLVWTGAGNARSDIQRDQRVHRGVISAKRKVRPGVVSTGDPEDGVRNIFFHDRVIRKWLVMRFQWLMVTWVHPDFPIKGLYGSAVWPLSDLEDDWEFWVTGTGRKGFATFDLWIAASHWQTAEDAVPAIPTAQALFSGGPLLFAALQASIILMYSLREKHL